MKILTLGVAFALLTVPAPAPAANTFSAKVVEVTSGSTFRILIGDKKETVALAGIAAPSKKPDLAKQAKENLAAKLANREVTIQPLVQEAPGPARGQPTAGEPNAARQNTKTPMQAAVWIGTRSINAEMVREGWAWYDVRRPEFKTLAQAEAEAKAARRGLWANPADWMGSKAERPPWESVADPLASPASTSPSSQPPATTPSVPGAAAKPESRELAIDDGKPAGKRSLPQGMAVKFKVPEGQWLLTAVKIHGSRYGYPMPPREDFHVTICDVDFNKIVDFPFPYSRFQRTSEQNWVTLRVKPTELPAGEFVLCVDFRAEATKGVYVSHDAKGEALVGRPGQPAGVFTGGDWLIHAVIQRAP